MISEAFNKDAKLLNDMSADNECTVIDVILSSDI